MDQESNSQLINDNTNQDLYQEKINQINNIINSTYISDNNSDNIVIRS